jgi:hypothetical protein
MECLGWGESSLSAFWRSAQNVDIATPAETGRELPVRFGYGDWEERTLGFPAGWIFPAHRFSSRQGLLALGRRAPEIGRSRQHLRIADSGGAADDPHAAT